MTIPDNKNSIKTRHDRPAVLLMGYEPYERLMAQLEDLSDLASLQIRSLRRVPGRATPVP